ncbi:hypothetical protein CPB84DRAFT_1744675 [Gymnopilus junonius]|uniref:Rho-GAP domain-containing protein n=1 Tax=Gymnopilus junonius TaxID=109634 RepID=A0A9P5NUN7_GYMJU|nr:hypothetical protein CPB84DRAFT_1744675 [Gymnopilus junonius]
MHQYQPPPPPTKQNLKAWWSHFSLNPKPKGHSEPYKGPPLSTPPCPSSSPTAEDNADHPVFGRPLRDSLKYASVQISTANANGELYVWGYIPVVVAKCGLYLKENATEVPGTFRVSGSNKRMRELQAVFETPPRYGKSLDWKKESYTTHDVASVFRRYLTQMPEPVIPYDMYHLFRDAMAKEPFNQEEVIANYKSLIRRMPRPNQYLLLYVLDLLSVFARKSDKNLMTATNLAVIFRPGLISHPSHEMSPQEHALSQRVLEFLIAQQDWFMLDISPPTPPTQSVVYEGPSGRGGGSGGNGNNNGGGGNWREGQTPNRQGTADNANGSGGGGSSSGTQTAAWHANMNAEAGPSRQRMLSRPDRSGTLPSPSHSPWTGGVIYSPLQQQQYPPQRQHQRQRSMSHSPSRSPEKQAIKDFGQGQFAEHVWSNSSSLPPSPLSATFPPNSDSSPKPERGQAHGQHVKSASASPIPTPIYSRFSHPPQTPTPTQAYIDPSQQRPQTHPPSTASSQHHNPAPNALPLSHRHVQYQHQQQHHSPLSSGSSDVDEHMIIPSGRPSSLQSEDEVSIAPFGSEGGLGGGWRLVQNPNPSLGLNGKAVQRHGGSGGFLALGKNGRGGKDMEKDKDNNPRMKMMRRRTAVDPSELAKRAMGASQTMRDTGISGSPLGGNGGGASVVRSKTLPSSSRRKGRSAPVETEDEEEYEEVENLPSLAIEIGKENVHVHEYSSSKEGVGMNVKSAKSKERRVLKKHRRVSAQTPEVDANSKMGTGTTTSPLALRS